MCINYFTRVISWQWNSQRQTHNLDDKSRQSGPYMPCFMNMFQVVCKNCLFCSVTCLAHLAVAVFCITIRQSLSSRSIYKASHLNWLWMPRHLYTTTDRIRFFFSSLSHKHILRCSVVRSSTGSQREVNVLFVYNSF